MNSITSFFRNKNTSLQDQLGCEDPGMSVSEGRKVKSSDSPFPYLSTVLPSMFRTGLYGCVAGFRLVENWLFKFQEMSDFSTTTGF